VEVSVIVCTRNRADSLARCLSSITADPSERAAEVVVVDNGSTDSTPAVLSAATRESPRPLRVVCTSARGHSRARNAGIKAAHGAILLFTDDDVVVQPGWIDALSEAFTDVTVGAVGGRIIPTFLCSRPHWLTDDEVFLPVTLPDYGTQPFRFNDGRLPIGANMAIRADLLDPDPFDPRLGHTGKLAIGFDEFLLLTRLARDYAVVYVPNAVVAHLLEDSRATLPAACRILFHIGFGSIRYQRMLGGPTPSLLRRVVRTRRAWWQVARASDGDPVAELNAWRQAGQQTEWLLGSRAPWLANWCAARLHK
jgi:glycosyltransferase involved in cell wall biosynthesis